MMRLYLIIILGIIGVNSCMPDESKKEKSQPNILIIQPDQHRGDILGCAGNTLVKTPNLDQLAAEGIRFSNAASASPVCSPFRATLQTGLYIHEHGVYVNGINLNHELQSIAEIFFTNGYETGYIGKWHLEGFVPKEGVGGYIETGKARQGWQEWLGYEKSHEFLEVWKYNEKKEKVRVDGYDWEPTWHTDMALDFIARKAKENSPWCYYIAYGPPHKPEQCIPEFLEKYNPDEFILPPDAEKNLSNKDKRKLRSLLQVYYAQVSAVDYEVGRLQQGLKDLGADENTIIIYVSDHGDVLGSHHREIVDKYLSDNRNINNTLRTKGKPFSMAFRIPLIIKGPGIKNPGMECSALVSSVDLAPTILDLAGIKVPEYMQGKSMSGWYYQGEGPRQTHLYMGLGNDHNAWRAVWDGQYLYSALDYKLMYNHSVDPFEVDNLYDNPDYASKRKELESTLLQLAEETGDPILTRLEESLSNNGHFD